MSVRLAAVLIIPIVASALFGTGPPALVAGLFIRDVNLSLKALRLDVDR